MKVLVLGASGMLGNAMFRVLSEDKNLEVYGTLRNAASRSHFDEAVSKKILTGIDVEQQDALVKLFATVRPDVVVNCIGVIKQLEVANDPLHTIPINSLFPHKLALLCKAAGARLVHISTDCVFSGAKGNYLEDDIPDPKDLYGRSKLLGEVDYSNAVTLRTSIIGHELSTQSGLLGWFLAQENTAKGFTKAIFSGLPTVELSRVVHQHVLPNPELTGLYHVAADPINKYELLNLIADTYNKQIDIIADDKLIIDRSLNAERFKKKTGYVAPKWPELIKQMHAFQ